MAFLTNFALVKRILKHILLSVAIAASPSGLHAQVNAEQVVVIGRNVLSMQDYMLAIQYFNAAIKAKPYMADPYFYRALAKLQLDDYQGAEEDCTLALDRNQFKVEAYKLRGFARQCLGRDSLAVEDFDRGLEYNPTDQYFLFYKAIAQTELHRLDDAEATMRDMLRQYPSFADGYTARARLRAEQGDTLAAIRDLGRAIDLNRTQVNPWLMRSELRSKRGEWESALSDMEEAIRLRPDDAAFHINRAYLRYNVDDLYGAMEDYNRALAIEPTSKAALFNRALLRLEVRDYPHAEEDLTQVLEMDNDNFHARYNRGIARMEMQHYKDALSDFRTIAKRYPKFYPVYYAMAQCEQEMGDMRRAVANVSRGDELVRRYVDDPTHNTLDRHTIAPGRANDQYSAKNVGSDEEADTELMERFNQLVTVDASDRDRGMAFSDKIKGRVQDRSASAEAQPLFALTFRLPERQLRPRSDASRELNEYNAGRYAGGRTLYMVAGSGSVSDEYGFEDTNALIESLTPLADRPTARPVDRLTRGVAYAMLRNYTAAMADLEAALRQNPQYTLALMARGAVRLEQGLADMDGKFESSSPEEASLRRGGAAGLIRGALDDFEEATRLSPRLPYAWYDKGCVLYDMHDYEAAAQAFTRAVELAPDLGQAWYNRALCHLAEGRRTQAFSDLGKAGEAGIVEAYPLLKVLGGRF